MQRIFLLCLIVAFFFQACNQTKTNNEEKKDSVKVDVVSGSLIDSTLEKTIYDFISAYENKNSVEVNKFIHPDFGLAVIYRPGAMDRFSFTDSIDFNKPIPEYWAYESIKRDSSLRMAVLPEFDCGLEKWNKLGLFCDTAKTPDELSKIMAFELEFDEAVYTQELQDKVKNLEKNSFRVIMTTESPLIFHVKKLDGKWYITTLDRAYAGCDA